MLDKNFDPKSFEKNFSFEIEASVRKPSADPLMILLPPPNVTGSLHIGHALCYTLQDILARYKRLKGFDVLFQPGLDHAGIVTQLVVEKQLYERGVERGTLSREGLLKEIWYWKENSGNRIIDQMKALGISCDFAKLKFTMDEDCKRAVAKLFVKLYEDGLLYRGEKMVNWDPMIRSAISDLEVAEKEVEGHLWYIKYMLEDSSEFIEVATTRPETIFGDTAVAVHPDDKRYKRFVGRNVIVPLTERVIPVIADKYADPRKGSGAVKITPAHDFNDFEVGKRHKLPVIDIMNANGELNNNVPDIFQRLDRFEARKLVIDLLKKKELLIKTEAIKQVLPFGDRSGVVLEPRITSQWFVNAEQLSKKAIEVVKHGRIKFIPKHWENLYFEWLDNIRPWCISRQIWWGHRIPAWYGPDGQVFVAETEEEAKQKAVQFYGKNRVKLVQDEDVLDTWFSSGMWPFITLGWPDNTPEMKRFYSNTVLLTGFDIIFFWVARMIMLGIYATGEIPFKDVYIHALVRDEKGQKMSKSKGNVIDPLELRDKYGADAVRYTLASMASPGRDIRMNEKLTETGRNFLTKFWNIVRFSQMNGCVYNKEFDPNKVTHPIAQWIINEVKNMIINVETAIDNYRFDEAVRHIYQCLWSSFCDWYIEFIKPIMQQSALNDGEKQNYDLDYTLLKKDVRDTTAWAILQFIRVLYPIAPFISKKLSGEMGVLEIEWPNIHTITANFSDAVKKIELIKEIITSIRSMKKYLDIPVGKKLAYKIESSDQSILDLINQNSAIIDLMAGMNLQSEVGRHTIPVVVQNMIVHIELEGKVDISAELKRLNKEVSKIERLKKDALSRLNNTEFLEKASPEIIREHKDRITNADAKINSIQYVIKSLESVI